MSEFPTFAGDRTAYDVLEVATDADADQLQQAHRRLIRQHHPDVVAGAGGDAAAVAQAGVVTTEVIVAYRVLRDPETRTAYDRWLHTPPVEEPEWIDLDEGWSDVVEATLEPEPAHTRTAEPRTVRRTAQLKPWLSTAASLAVLALAATRLTGVAAAICCFAAVSAATGVLVVALRRFWRDNVIVAFRHLRPGVMFGGLGPDPQAGRVDLLVWALLSSLPAAVAIRRADSQAPFSHAVACGDRVAFVRGVAASPGAYHWQSTSLIRVSAFDWTVAATADWPTVADWASRQRRFQVRLWTVLYPSGQADVAVSELAGGPTLGLEAEVSADMTAWLSEGTSIKHRVVAEAVRGLRLG